jgi:hypothetical protein
MSDINFCNTKEQLNHLGEVVTGKVDGSPTGADIDTSTLPYTGQVRKTLPALEGEYEQSIVDKEAEADAAIDAYRLLSKGPYAAGILLEDKFQYITYNGESYFAVNPPYTTTATTPDTDGNLFAGGYLTSQQLSLYTDIVYKASGGNSAVENMIAGIPVATSVGQTCQCESGTIFKRIGNATVGIDDYKPLSPVNVKDFGAVGDGVTDDWQAIHNAVRAAMNLGGCTIYYPAGTYLISRAIRLDNFDYDTDTYTGVYDGITHKGAGKGSTVILTTEYASGFSAFPEPYWNQAAPPRSIGTNIVIEDMTIDCDYTKVPDYATSTYSTGIYYDVVKLGGTWKNGSSTPALSFWASDNYQYPIYTFLNDDVLIRNCAITNSWYNGIEIFATYRITVEDCDISHCGDKANYYGHYSGIEVDQDSIVINLLTNTIRNCGFGINSNGDAVNNTPTLGVNSVVIKGNHIRDCSQWGIYCWDWITDWVVTDNILRNIGKEGISFTFIDPSGSGRNGRHPRNITISNNQILEYNLENTSNRAAIRFNGSAGLISDNIIKQTNATTNACIGIITLDSNITSSLDSGEQNISITSNQLTGRFLGSDGVSGLIYVGSSYTSVMTNTLSTIGSDAYQGICLRGDHTYVEGNNLKGSYSFKGLYQYSGIGGYVKDHQHGAYLYVDRTTPATYATGAHNVEFNNAPYDKSGSFVTDMFTAPYNGDFKVTATIEVSGLSSDVMFLGIRKNDAADFNVIATDIVSRGFVTTTSVISMLAGNTLSARATCTTNSFQVEAGSFMEISTV